MIVAEPIVQLQKLPSDELVIVEADRDYADVGVPLGTILVLQKVDLDPGAIGSYAEHFAGYDAVLIATSSPP